MNTTINYYNLNAKNFIENTQNADMHLAQEKFLQLLPGSASILDFGSQKEVPALANAK